MNSLTRILTTEIKLHPIKFFVHAFLTVLGRLPLALLVGSMTTYQAYVGSLFLVRFPQGAVIRPMVEGAYAGFIILFALAVGMPLAIGEVYRSVRDKRRVGLALGIIGLILCLSTWEVSDYFWNYYQNQRGIQFEQ